MTSRSSAVDVQAEERAARGRHRALQRAQRAAAKSRERAAKGTIAQAIRDTAHLKGCRCGLRAGMTHADLKALGAGCTAPRWICPRLDSVRRRVGR